MLTRCTPWVPGNPKLQGASSSFGRLSHPLRDEGLSSLGINYQFSVCHLVNSIVQCWFILFMVLQLCKTLIFKTTESKIYKISLYNFCKSCKILSKFKKKKTFIMISKARFELRSVYQYLGPQTLDSGQWLTSLLFPPQFLPIQQGDLHRHMWTLRASLSSSGHSPLTLHIASPWPPWGQGMCTMAVPPLGEQKVSGSFGQGISESWGPGTEAGVTHRLQGVTFLASVPEKGHRKRTWRLRMAYRLSLSP